MSNEKVLTVIKKWFFPTVSLILLLVCVLLFNQHSETTTKLSALEKFKDEALQDGIERYIPGHLVGDEFTHGFFQYKVLKVTTSEGDEENQPSEGYIFAHVELSLENISDEVQFYYPRRFLQLADINGTFYNFIPTSETREMQSIEPSETITLKLTFEVLRDLSNAKLRINTYGEDSLASILLNLS